MRTDNPAGVNGVFRKNGLIRSKSKEIAYVIWHSSTTPLQTRHNLSFRGTRQNSSLETSHAVILGCNFKSLHRRKSSSAPDIISPRAKFARIQIAREK